MCAWRCSSLVTPKARFIPWAAAHSVARLTRSRRCCGWSRGRRCWRRRVCQACVRATGEESGAAICRRLLASWESRLRRGRTCRWPAHGRARCGGPPWPGRHWRSRWEPTGGKGSGRALGVAGEAVADVAHRLDQLLVLRAELGAQAPDVHVDGAGAAVVVVAPQLAEELFAGEDAPPVARRVTERSYSW